MARRPRIDLDGVPLTDVHNTLMPLVIFRHRTTEGLIFQIPESGDVLVSWDDVDEARVDLRTGEVELVLSDDLVRSQNWLRGAKRLNGRWLDRLTLPADGLGATPVAPRRPTEA